MFFNSIKEINRLKKEISRLLSKGMSNIYLIVTIENKFVSTLVFRQLQLTPIQLNFQTSFNNLKIRDLSAKVCVTSLLFLF